jgi:hypothetical protein
VIPRAFKAPLRRSVDLSGQRFGRWVCKTPGGVRSRGERLWLCLCDCGVEREVLGTSLRSGRSTSCGCLRPKGSQWTVERRREAKKKWRKKDPKYRAKESKRWREADPDRFKARHRDHNYRAKYGLRLVEVEALWKAQDGRCAICNEPVSFGGKGGARLDHDHATDKARGILCNRCNCGLGQFRDNPALLAAAAEYVVKYKAGSGEGEVGVAG